MHERVDVWFISLRYRCGGAAVQCGGMVRCFGGTVRQYGAAVPFDGTSFGYVVYIWYSAGRFSL